MQPKFIRKLINHGNTPRKRWQQKKYEPNQRTQIVYCMTHNLRVFTLFKVFPFLTYLLLWPTSLKKIDPNNTSKLVYLKLHPSKMTLHKTTCQFKLVMKWAKKKSPNLAQMHDLFFISIMNKQKKPPRNWWFFVGYFMTITSTLNF
jgi:hypothetical protein